MSTKRSPMKLKVDLGRGNLKLQDVQDLISGEGSARSNAMPAKGLCLEKIIYENYCDLIL